jgi:hypothetical protein
LFREEKKLELSRELFVQHVSSVLSPRVIQKAQKAANIAKSEKAEEREPAGFVNFISEVMEQRNRELDS